jgi:NitT/TauT family transport system substrate-binding protein
VRSRRSWLSAAAAGLAASSAPAIWAQPAPLHLRVGATANDTYAEAYYALDQGFFRKANLDVEIVTLNNGNAVAAGIAGGTLDVGVATPLQVALAYLRGFPFKLLAAGALSTRTAPSITLVVKQNAPLHGPKDFEGKAVAMNVLRNVSEISLDVWLTQGGAEVGKVKPVELPYSEMVPALQRGNVDGVIIAEPVLSIALAGGDVQALTELSTTIAPQWLASGWFATTAYLQNNADVARRYAAAIYETARWANAKPGDSAAILAKYSKLDPQVIRKMTRCPYTDAIRLSDIQPQLDVATKYGLLARAVSAADLIYRP